MRLAVLFSLLACWSLHAFGQEPIVREGPYVRQIHDLGDEDYRVREKAHQELRQAGEAAKAALELAVEENPDAEVRQRAELLLRRLTAGPRIKSALGQLESPKWDEVKEAITVLCDEFGEGNGAEDAVRKASEGKGQTALIARVLRQQWDNWAQQQQQYMHNISSQGTQYMQQYFSSFRQNMRRSIEFMCKREFDQLRAKQKGKKGQDDTEGEQ